MSQFMRMKFISSLFALLLGLGLFACVTEPKESEVDFYSTFVGTLPAGDTSGTTVWWLIPIESESIKHYSHECDWAYFLGHSDSSASFDNNSPGWSSNMPTGTNNFHIDGPADSAFTHYRIEVDCTEEARKPLFPN
jgi:hypothetical protein